MLAVLGHLLRRHAEGIGVHLEALVAADELLARERVDLLDQRIGHGVAAGRLALAVHHQEFAGAPVRLVVGVRVAEVESQMEAGVRIHLLVADGVEALGRLLVALPLLGAEIARPVADRIGLEVVEAAVVALLPELQLRLFLEDADEDRRFRLHALLAQEHHGLLGKRPHGGRENIGAAARQDGCNNRRKSNAKQVPAHSPPADECHSQCPWHDHHLNSFWLR